MTVGDPAASRSSCARRPIAPLPRSPTLSAKRWPCAADPPVLGCAFVPAAVELAADAAITVQSARALGGIAQAAGHPPNFIFSMAAASAGRAGPAARRLLPDGMLSRRCAAAGRMAGTGGAMGRVANEAAFGGRRWRQGRLAREVKFRQNRECRGRPKCCLGAGVESRARDWASTGGGRVDVEAARVVYGHWPGSPGLCDGADHTRGARRPKNGARSASLVCLCWLSVASGQAQARTFFPTHPTNTGTASMHGDDLYMA